jgi:hypothetical protein
MKPHTNILLQTDNSTLAHMMMDLGYGWFWDGIDDLDDLDKLDELDDDGDDHDG